MSLCLNYCEEYDFSDIPGSESWIKLSEITAGDSTDRKFYVKNCDRERFFLRIADRSAYDRKKNEYEYMKTVRSFGIPVPDPVGFGICNRGRSLYLQTRWIYGVPGPLKLTEVDRFYQYYFGTEAGLFLKYVHHCKIPPRRNCWAQQQAVRIGRIMEFYQSCRHKIPYDRKLFDLILRCQPLMADRPQVLLHGDFKNENIIMSYEYSLNLIDFDSWQYGDPMFDLANVLTSIHKFSHPYALGILDCYFAFRVTDLEMQLITCYAVLNLLEKLIAVQKEADETIGLILEEARTLMRDFQGFKRIDPVWYKRIHIPSNACLIEYPAD